MAFRAARFGAGRVEAWSCGAFDGNAWASTWTTQGLMPPGTPLGLIDSGFASARARGKLRVGHRKMNFTSSRVPACGWRGHPIGEKVIGHGGCVFRRDSTGDSLFPHLLRPFPLLHQPARKHGRGVFLHPLIEKCADLFAEICGMAESREFIALQRIARGREQELPRGLGPVVGHVGLLNSGLSTLILR